MSCLCLLCLIGIRVGESLSSLCAFCDLKSIETLSRLKMLAGAYALMEHHCGDVPKKASSRDAFPAGFTWHHISFYFVNLFRFPFVVIMEVSSSPLLKSSISTGSVV